MHSAFSAPAILPLRPRGVASSPRRRPLAARPRAHPRASVSPPSSSPSPSQPDPVSEAAVLQLLRSPEKGPQQRGLLLARRLPPEARLRALLFSVRSSSNEWIRATAAVGLGQLRGADEGTRKQAVEALLSLLAGDRDFSIRAAAAAGCGYLRDDGREGEEDMIGSVVDELIRCCFEDLDWQVQFSCLVSLGNLGDARACPVLVEALKSENDLIVQGAVGACGDLGITETVAPLLECLASNDMMTRQRLAHALGCFPATSLEPSVVDALQTLAGDPSFAVREAAVDSLTRYGIPTSDNATGTEDSSMSNDERIEREVAAILSGDFDLREAEGSKRTEEAAAEALRRRLERSYAKNAVNDFGEEEDGSEDGKGSERQ